MALKEIITRLLVLLIPFSCFLHAEEKDVGVTYTFSGGRLGDNLVAYIHAKYIAHLFDMPLYFKPFTYSDQFMMDKLEKKYDPGIHTGPHVVFEKDEDFAKFQERKALYVIPYFPDFDGEYIDLYHGQSFEMNWEDKKFIAKLKTMIAPVNPIETLRLNKNRINVALHIRKAGGSDSVHMSNLYFLKFAPEDFYINQIKRICKCFPTKKIYAHIFTNDPNPQAIAERFQKQLKGFPVKMGFRNGNQEPYVLQDFFSMLKFDVIIRSEANLSYIAAKIGKAIIEIFPVRGHWEEGQKIIDEVRMIDKRTQNSLDTSFESGPSITRQWAPNGVTFR